MRLPCKAIVVGLVLGAGCGKSPEDPGAGAVRAAAVRYLDALLERDYAGACAVMSATMRDNARRESRGAETCAGALERLAPDPGGALRGHRAVVEESRVAIEGRIATVGLARDGEVPEDFLFFVRERGEWRLTPGRP